jgi:transposase
MRALERKPIQIPIAMNAYRQAIEDISEQIKTIEQEIKRLLNDDQNYRTLLTILTSVTGVGFVVATNLIALTDGFTRGGNYKQLAVYCGISPIAHTSGTSVYRKPRSLGFGPGTLRKVLYLSSLSLCTHNPQFRHYYLRKVAEKI